MVIETLVENKVDYIHFRLKGEFPGLDVLNGFDKIVEANRKFNINNILLDIREFDYDLSDMESFTIGEYIAKNYRETGLKVACLRSPNKNNDFTETVAVNRGVSFKLFNEEDQAIKWLKG